MLRKTIYFYRKIIKVLLVSKRCVRLPLGCARQRERTHPVWKLKYTSPAPISFTFYDTPYSLWVFSLLPFSLSLSLSSYVVWKRGIITPIFLETRRFLFLYPPAVLLIREHVRCWIKRSYVRSTKPEELRVCKRTLGRHAWTRKGEKTEKDRRNGGGGEEERKIEREGERESLDGRKWWKNVREVLVKLLRPWDCPVRRIRQGIVKSKGKRWR